MCYKVRFSNLIDFSGFLYKCYGRYAEIVNGNTLKERLQIRKKGLFRGCLGVGLGAVYTPQIVLAVSLKIHILVTE